MRVAVRHRSRKQVPALTGEGIVTALVLVGRQLSVVISPTYWRARVAAGLSPCARPACWALLDVL
jgi:hypothetical protein